MRSWLRTRRREATVLWHRLQPGPHALILAYHRVIELPTDPYHLCTPPDLFRRHLDLLHKHVVPLADVAAGAPGVALTFDDGYFDNLETVAPMLLERRLPATFFVTAYPRDREFWWNELEQVFLKSPTRWRLYTETPPTPAARQLREAYRQLARRPQAHHGPLLQRWRGDAPLPVRPTHRLLSDDELRRLAQDFEIGAHTLNHERLSLLEPEQQSAEIEGSRRQVESLLQRPVEAFAYPYGVYNDTSVSLVRQTFTHACTIAPGLVNPYTDRCLLPRVHADSLAPEALAALLRIGDFR